MSLKQPMFAVVDLETTGTKRTEDQIIQFGCAFIQKNKIVNTISQNINPQQAIPPAITDLTGITNGQVAKAPTFAEIGPALHGMLTDTVFVAHNVNFDFPFLNHAFEQIGLPALDIAAIDTVELAQILLPTAVSYKLQDLTALLGIQHKNPHHADSDAFVTARLFLALRKRLLALPTQTVSQLSRLGTILSRQTGDFIETVAKQQPNHALADDLHKNHGLILHNKTVLSPQDLHPEVHYPQSPAAKKKMWGKRLTYRAAQAKMMNLIANHLQKPADSTLIIEAATGSGKSLGYLLPSYYYGKPEHKVVVSTATTVLQHQLLNQTLPLLESLLHTKVPVALVKSPEHYLNLEAFYQSLQMPSSNRPNRILQMRLLVWLTMTSTGDLTELQLTNYRGNFLQRVRQHHFQVQSLFGPDEFIVSVADQAQKASLILTNHSFLLAHPESPLFGTRPDLMIDEAEDFTHFAQRVSRHTSEFTHLREAGHHLNQHRDVIEAAAEQTYPAYAKLTKGYEQVGRYLELIEACQQIFFESYIEDNIPKSRRTETLHEIIDLANLDLETYILPKLAEIEALSQKAAVNFEQAVNQLVNLQPHFQHQTGILFNQIYAILEQLKKYNNAFAAFQAQMTANDGQSGVILNMQQYGNVASLDLTLDRLDIAPAIRSIFAGFDHVVLTGATLSFNHRFDYFLNQLGLSKAEVQTFKLPSIFDYAKQTRLITITDAPNIKLVTTAYQADYTSGVIDRIAASQSGQILVLFNSLETVKQTYYSLKDLPTGHNREILAQGITGSNEKILKRFSLSQHAVLLGSNTFLTGIDLPGDALKVLILNRLPFDSPSQPEVKLRYHWLKANGQYPFRAEALPKAALRMKQSFGRLIRTKTDSGVMVVLDDRLVTTRYGRQMLHTLPNSVVNHTLNLAEAVKLIQKFLKK